MIPNQSNQHTIRHLLDIIRYRAFAELRAEGSRTYAGYLWWILQPLLMFGVYYIAFKYVMHNDTENFAVFLFAGIVLWQWFSVTVLRCADSLIAARGLMQQVNLHKSVYPFSIIMTNMVKFAITFVLLCVVLIIAGFTPTLVWFTLPVLLAIELLIICAVGCFSAMISPFIPDFRHVLATLLQLMFFISGIIYDLSILPERIQSVLGLNPMAIVISETRGVLMYSEIPDPGILLISVIQAAALLCISLSLLHRFDKTYPKISK